MKTTKFREEHGLFARAFPLASEYVTIQRHRKHRQQERRLARLSGNTKGGIPLTPPRLVQFACPTCQGQFGEIDSDYRGGDLFGGIELSYPEREYDCPHCGARNTNCKILQKGPPEFFLQPHDLYPMSVADFNHWYAVFAANFPQDERRKMLGSAGIRASNVPIIGSARDRIWEPFLAIAFACCNSP
jgi:hypothetical protein